METRQGIHTGRPSVLQEPLAAVHVFLRHFVWVEDARHRNLVLPFLGRRFAQLLLFLVQEKTRRVVSCEFLNSTILEPFGTYRKKKFSLSEVELAF